MLFNFFFIMFHVQQTKAKMCIDDLFGRNNYDTSQHPILEEAHSTLPNIPMTWCLFFTIGKEQILIKRLKKKPHLQLNFYLFYLIIWLFVLYLLIFNVITCGHYSCYAYKHDLILKGWEECTHADVWKK